MAEDADVLTTPTGSNKVGDAWKEIQELKREISRCVRLPDSAGFVPELGPTFNGKAILYNGQTIFPVDPTGVTDVTFYAAEMQGRLGASKLGVDTSPPDFLLEQFTIQQYADSYPLNILQYMTQEQRDDYIARTKLLDLTDPINRAINLSRIHGRKVYCPPGTALIQGKLQANSFAFPVFLDGAGIGLTELYFDNGSQDCIEMNGLNAPELQVTGYGIRDMTLRCNPLKSGGRTIAVNGVYKCHFENLLILDCWTGIEVYISNNADFRNVNVQMVKGGSNQPQLWYGPASHQPEVCYGLYWHAPQDGTRRSDAIRTINVTVQADNSGADGFLWAGGATTWDAYQTTALSCRKGLTISNPENSPAIFPQYGEFHNFNTDGMQEIGLHIKTGALMRFIGCNITNTSAAPNTLDPQGGNDTNACRIEADSGAGLTRQLQFIGCNFANNGEDTVYCNGKNVHFVGCIIQDGGKKAAGTYSGMIIGPQAEDIIVSALNVGMFGANNNYKHALSVAAGSLRVSVHGVRSFNNTEEVVKWENTDSFSRCTDVTPVNQFSSSEATYRAPADIDLVAGNVTVTPAQLAGGMLLCINSTANRTITFPTAAQLIKEIPNQFFSMTFTVMVMNINGFQLNVAGGAGVTMNGNIVGGQYVIPAGQTRTLIVRLLGFAAGAEQVAVYG